MKNMYPPFLNNQIEILIEDKEVLDLEIKMAMNNNKILTNIHINRMIQINILIGKMNPINTVSIIQININHQI